MHDLVIRGGTIVDGTGAPGFVGDVAMNNGIIVAVGGDIGPGRQEIDATGNIVTPGFVDTHTHYDGQVTWDPQLSPAAWHGVTTAIMGNCGMGFAPVRPGVEARDYLIKVMEGVEDIPGTVLAEGVSWDWESSPNISIRSTASRTAIDVVAQVPHAPLARLCHGPRPRDRRRSDRRRHRRNGPADQRSDQGRRAWVSPPRALSST